MHPKAMSETDKYRSKGRPGVGGIRTKGDKKILSDPLECTLTLIIPNSRLILPQESKNGLANICQSGDESTDELKSTQETSDLSLNPLHRHVKDDSNLILDLSLCLSH